MAEEYSISIIKPEEGNKIIEFMVNFFYRDEPLNTCINSVEGASARCKEREEYRIRSLNNGYCVKAETKSGKLIGILLNNPGYKNEEKEEKHYSNPNLTKIVNLLLFLDKIVPIFEKYPEYDKLMNLDILSVDDAYRGRGVATALVEYTKNISDANGFKLLRMDCTSSYSAKAAKKLGFELVYSLNYKDYKDEQGIQVFSPQPPHSEITVFVKKI